MKGIWGLGIFRNDERSQKWRRLCRGVIYSYGRIPDEIARTQPGTPDNCGRRRERIKD